MCGRFAFNEETLRQVSKIARVPEFIQEKLHFSDIYPSQESLVIENDHDHLSAALLPFGYYSDYFKKRIINARAQGLEGKWMFRKALAHHRILIPCSGFYEWDPAKTKNFFYRSDQPVLYMAGLAIEDGFVIITTNANHSVLDVHHRMPLILPLEMAEKWVLDPEVPSGFLSYEPLLLQRESETPRLF